MTFSSRAIVSACGFVVCGFAAVVLYFGRGVSGYPVAPRQELMTELFREASAVLRERGASAKRSNTVGAIELYGIEHDQLGAAALLPPGTTLVTAAEMRAIYGVDVPGFGVDIVLSQHIAGTVSFGSSAYSVEPVVAWRDMQVLSNPDAYRRVAVARRVPALVLPDGVSFVGALWIAGVGRGTTWVWPETQPLVAFVRIIDGKVDAAAFLWRSSDWLGREAAVLRTWDGSGRVTRVSEPLTGFSVHSGEENRDMDVIGEGMPAPVARALLVAAFLLMVWVGPAPRRGWLDGIAIAVAVGAMGAVAWWRKAPVLAQSLPWDLRYLVLLLEFGCVAGSGYAVGAMLRRVRERR